MRIKDFKAPGMLFSFAKAKAGILAFTALFTLIACSIPNLEPQDCTDSRTALREFYSFHFGNDMRFSLDNLKLRRPFLTESLFQSIENSPPGTDPFTVGTDDFPKAFRVGACKIANDGNPLFEVLLFWKDDRRSEQRSIWVSMRKQNDKWLVDKISQVKQ